MNLSKEELAELVAETRRELRRIAELPDAEREAILLHDLKVLRNVRLKIAAKGSVN